MSSDTVDLTAQVVNLELTRGDAWSFQVEFVGMDLTGYSFSAQIRKSPDAEEFVSLDIAETDLPNGIISIGQDSGGSRAGADGYWDLQLTTPGGLPRTYIKGSVDVDKDVTR